MIQSIRGRIATLSLALLLGAVLLVGWLVLGGLARALAELADRGLRGEIEELVTGATDRRLSSVVAPDRAASVPWGDLVFELRDALDARAARSGEEDLVYEIRRGGALVAASASLAGSPLARSGAEVERGGIRFREERDPRSQAADAGLRVAALPLGPYELQIGRSLAPLRSIQGAVRAQVAAILVGVSLLGAIGAWLVAARGLAPVRRLAREAERLRTLAHGALPRSGRGDEVDELAAILNELLDRVRREVERQRQFTADAAHEIRTPLAAIRGHLELLLPHASEDAQPQLVGVLEELERLSRLVSRLLLLEKLEEGDPSPRREAVDLLALAGDLADHLGVVAAEQGIDLDVRGPSALVWGDPEQLRQVLLNLLDNAFRHTPPGGRVRVEIECRGDRVLVRVDDTGPGIPPERQEDIFDRFSSDRSRPQAGTGLGLPIARAIARSHGGELRALPSAGGGLFEMDLPAAPR
jgi:signal transduction histidine kinase